MSFCGEEREDWTIKDKKEKREGRERKEEEGEEGREEEPKLQNTSKREKER